MLLVFEDEFPELALFFEVFVLTDELPEEVLLALPVLPFEVFALAAELPEEVFLLLLLPVLELEAPFVDEVVELPVFEAPEDLLLSFVFPVVLLAEVLFDEDSFVSLSDPDFTDEDDEALLSCFVSEELSASSVSLLSLLLSDFCPDVSDVVALFFLATAVAVSPLHPTNDAAQSDTTASITSIFFFIIISPVLVFVIFFNSFITSCKLVLP